METRASILVWSGLGLVVGAGLGPLCGALHPVEFEGYEQNLVFQALVAALPGGMIGAQLPRWGDPRNAVRGWRRGLFIAAVIVTLTLISAAILGFSAVLAEYRPTGQLFLEVALFLGAEAGLRVSLRVLLTAAPATALVLLGLRAALAGTQ